ncbi:MAG: DUF4838 domain-containing protein [Armatimonadota bacterium]|jgi:hypothetical protein
MTAARILLVTFALVLLSTCSVFPETARLAAGGQALMPVVIAPDASEEVQEAAADLAEYLGRIAGAQFGVTAADGSSGIVLGSAADFPALAEGEDFAPDHPLRREEYIIRSEADRLLLIGATAMAAEHATWDLLHRLGYRQYFPGERWEVVPTTPDLQIDVADREAPDYHARRIWYGHGLWDYNAEPYARWCLRNRARSGMTLNTGHAYGRIIRAKAEQFTAHPEYYALVDGERRFAGEVDGRGNIKFCISNPGLRELVVEYAIEYFEQDPDADSISMDPSDGANWCECDDCEAMGSISDRALTLANEVAQAVNERFGEKFVGMYAYNQHSPPPSIEVHPNVIISVATAFIRGGYTLDELIEGWQRQGATIGMREYLGVNVWDRDVPGRARGTNLDYVTTTIPDFHAKGARFYSSESSDSWGPNGLGYFLAARLLWDIEEAALRDETVERFIADCFGPAAAPMREFYALIDGSNAPLFSRDLVGRMYRHLDAARAAAGGDEAVQGRISDLVLYARYAELFLDYSTAGGEARQQAFEDLIRHAYRMRETMMVHTRALYRDLVNRDNAVSIPEGAEWNVDEEQNPWKDSAPFSETELAAFIAEGIEANPVVEIEAVRFSDDLIPARPLALEGPVEGSMNVAVRSRQVRHLWIDEAPAELLLQVTGGLIAHYRDRGNVQFELYADAEATLEPVDGDMSVPPDGEQREIVLRTPWDGLHRLEWTDGGDRTQVVFPEGLPVTVRSDLEQPARLEGRWTLVFYVPEGTETVGGYATNPTGEVVNADGEVAFSFEEMSEAGYFAVPVGEGQDGRLWALRNCSGQRMLMTVPPYLAESGETLLLPREVVEAR